jgi:hypothetical protein
MRVCSEPESLRARVNGAAVKGRCSHMRNWVDVRPNSCSVTTNVDRLFKIEVRGKGTRLRGSYLFSERFGHVQLSAGSPGLGEPGNWLSPRHLPKTHH